MFNFKMNKTKTTNSRSIQIWIEQVKIRFRDDVNKMNKYDRNDIS